MKIRSLLPCIGYYKTEKALGDDYDKVYNAASAFRESYCALIKHARASNVRVPRGILGELLQEPDDGVFNVPSGQDAAEEEHDLAVA
jgi:hypothetical protein